MAVLSIERHGNGVVALLFDRPNRKNAFNAELYDACASALNAADADDEVAAVILSSSTGGIFSSGADLSEGLTAHDAERWRDRAVGRFMLSVLDFRKLLVAAVDGPAVGIGVTMLMYCDFVWATARSTFWVPFLEIGIVPEFGSSTELRSVVGAALSRELLLGGRRLDAQAALSAGLVGRELERDAGTGRAVDRASALVRGLLQTLPAGKQGFETAKRLARGDAWRARLERTLDAEFQAIAARARAGHTRLSRM